TPAVLAHYVEHARSLHERVILLTVTFDRVPRVPRGERATVEELGKGFVRVVVHTGFMEKPDLPARLADACVRARLPLDLAPTTALARSCAPAATRPASARTTPRAPSAAPSAPAAARRSPPASPTASTFATRPIRKAAASISMPASRAAAIAATSRPATRTPA